MTRTLLGVASLAWLFLADTARADALLIIANPNVEVTIPLPMNQVAAIYLLRITTWPDGTHVVPVNREATSKVRDDFTTRVLQLDNAELTIYWNEMHFMGKLPPVVQESQQAMIAFVRNVPGSIGYISGTEAPAAVKVLAYVP